MIKPGPVEARAKFSNLEEVDLKELWFDPIHDFGFFQYNPKDLRFQTNQVEIPLVPSHATVGTQIRVIGNNANEKLSILSGILARLDRAAPKYGMDNYNDHNTFYYQAASMTSGGSSGSPVINIDGEAVALNAGSSKKAASSYYLPLDRPLRALQIIRKCLAEASDNITPNIFSHIPRGTIQTIFHYETYDQLRRIGLPEDVESTVRKENPAGKGLLLVERVLPNSPSYKQLIVGDIIYKINGQFVFNFIELEQLEDDNVAKTLEFEIIRNGNLLKFQIFVNDFFELIPKAYIIFAGAIIHQISFTQASNHLLPVQGLVIASSGYIFSKASPMINENAAIIKIDDCCVSTLQEFIDFVSNKPHGSRVSLQYFYLGDRDTIKSSIVTVVRKWHLFHYCFRDTSGEWKNQIIPETDLGVLDLPGKTTKFPILGNRILNRFQKSLVFIKFTAPYSINGTSVTNYIGAGIIVDTSLGLVIVDKNTVPLSIGDLSIVISGSIEIDANIIYIHPIHNYAIIQYSPSSIGSTEVLPIEFAPNPAELGDNCVLVGLNDHGNLTQVSSVITHIESFKVSSFMTPRERSMNVEVIKVDSTLGTIGGLLCNTSYEVQALWFCYSKSKNGKAVSTFRGLPVCYVADTIASIRASLKKKEHFTFYSLEVEFCCLPLYQAQHLKLPEDWVEKLESNPKRQVVKVRKPMATSPASKWLEEGDLLLSIDDAVVTNYRDIEIATATKQTVDLTIWRDCKLHRFTVDTIKMDGRNTSKLLMWSGAFIQESFRELQFVSKKVPKGVYVVRYYYGSPADFYGLRAKIWVTSVNGIKTPDIDTFLQVVKSISDDTFIQIRTKNVKGVPGLLTLKPNTSYWDTVLFSLNDSNQWTREIISDVSTKR